MGSKFLGILIAFGCLFVVASSHPRSPHSSWNVMKRQQDSSTDLIEIPPQNQTSSNPFRSQEKESKKGSDTLTPAEQKMIFDELQKNPDATLWTVFRKDITQRWRLWTRNPSRALWRLPIEVVIWIFKVIVQMIKDTWIGVKWIFRSVFIDRPQGRKDIREFFNELWVAMKMLGHMIWEDPATGLLNFFGGLLFYITHHSVDFTAQVVLLVALGFGVIGRFTDTVAKTLKAANVSSDLAETIKQMILGFLWGVHCIDDPLNILSSILPAIQAGASLSTTPNEPLTSNSTTALLDPEFVKSNPDEARDIIRREIFQMDDKTPKDLKHMSKKQVSRAYDNMISFVCTHSAGQVLKPSNLTFPQQDFVSIPSVIDLSDQCHTTSTSQSLRKREFIP